MTDRWDHLLKCQLAQLKQNKGDLIVLKSDQTVQLRKEDQNLSMLRQVHQPMECQICLATILQQKTSALKLLKLLAKTSKKEQPKFHRLKQASVLEQLEIKLRTCSIIQTF